MQKKLLTASVMLALSTSVWATTGMQLEGYGTRSVGMGGTGTALDVGAAAVMNNPAMLTESLKEDGDSMIGVGLTILSPDITSSVPSYGVSTDSDGTAYFMPGFGYMRRDGNLVWGAAVMAQGGMGTEYGRAGMGDLFSGGLSMMQQPVPLSGQEVRSEASVGRVMFPFAYQVSDRMTLAAQLDYVWAGLDLQMDLDGNSFVDFANPQLQHMGVASGSMVDGFLQLVGMGAIADVNWARFDFSNSSDFTGQAFGTGFGYKLGFSYKATDRVTIGGFYHSRTNVSDLDTNDASVSFNIDMNTPQGVANMTANVDGKIIVRDFNWPSIVGVGVSWEATDDWTFAMDIKRLNWSEVMTDFKVSFVADGSQADPVGAAFAGAAMDVTMFQNWDDQLVVNLGGEYRMSDALKLRAGMLTTSNPVPNEYVNPLFPATIENTYMAGLGYQMSESSEIGIALAYAPEVDVTNTMSGIRTTHGQLNWHFQYGIRF